MNPQRWERVKALFERARTLPGSERAAYLSGECGDDAELMREVMNLVEADTESKGFLEAPFQRTSEDPISFKLPDYAGRRIGAYQLEREIGRGGMAVVYLAQHTQSKRSVALKILAPLFWKYARRAERFRREIRAASRLEHPNIVSILDHGDVDGTDYYAMEYVRGPNLKQALVALEQGTADAEAVDLSDPRAVADVVMGVARALEYLHTQRLIHRDVKPQNILLDEHGQPRLLDFGLAQDLELESLTESGDISGTPHYMSPEQARGRRKQIDHRTDVYSLGAVLYELLTRSVPFEGHSASEVIYNIRHTQPRRIQALNHSVPRPLVAICTTAMQKRPQDRYESAAALADDLRAFLDGKQVAARYPTLWSRARTGLSQIPRSPLKLRVAALLGVAVVIVAGILAFAKEIEASRTARHSRQEQLVELDRRAGIVLTFLGRVESASERELLQREVEHVRAGVHELIADLASKRTRDRETVKKIAGLERRLTEPSASVLHLMTPEMKRQYLKELRQSTEDAMRLFGNIDPKGDAHGRQDQDDRDDQ